MKQKFKRGLCYLLAAIMTTTSIANLPMKHVHAAETSAEEFGDINDLEAGVAYPLIISKSLDKSAVNELTIESNSSSHNNQSSNNTIKKISGIHEKILYGYALIFDDNNTKKCYVTYNVNFKDVDDRPNRDTTYYTYKNRINNNVTMRIPSSDVPENSDDTFEVNAYGYVSRKSKIDDFDNKNHHITNNLYTTVTVKKYSSKEFEKLLPNKIQINIDNKSLSFEVYKPNSNNNDLLEEVTRNIRSNIDVQYNNYDNLRDYLIYSNIDDNLDIRNQINDILNILFNIRTTNEFNSNIITNLLNLESELQIAINNTNNDSLIRYINEINMFEMIDVYKQYINLGKAESLSNIKLPINGIVDTRPIYKSEVNIGTTTNPIEYVSKNAFEDNYRLTSKSNSNNSYYDYTDEDENEVDDEFNININLYLANNAKLYNGAFSNDNRNNSTNDSNVKITIYNFENIATLGERVFYNTTVDLSNSTTKNEGYMLLNNTQVDFSRNAFDNSTIIGIDTIESGLNTNNLSEKLVFYLLVKGNNNDYPIELQSNSNRFIVMGDTITLKIYDSNNNHIKTQNLKVYENTTYKIDAITEKDGYTFDYYEVLNTYNISTSNIYYDNAIINSKTPMFKQIDPSMNSNTSIVGLLTNPADSQTIKLREHWSVIPYKYTFQGLYSDTTYKIVNIDSKFTFSNMERYGYIFKGWKEYVEEPVEEDTTEDESTTEENSTTEEDSNEDTTIVEEVLYAAGEEFTVTASDLEDKVFVPVFEFDESILFEEDTSVRAKELIDTINSDKNFPKLCKTEIKNLIEANINDNNIIDMNTLIIAINESNTLSNYNKERCIKKVKSSYEDAVKLVTENDEKAKADEEAEVAAKLAEEEQAKLKAEAEAKAKEEAIALEEAKKLQDEADRQATKDAIAQAKADAEAKKQAEKLAKIEKYTINTLKVKNLKGKKIKVTFKKLPDVKSYKVQISTSKNFTKKTTKTYTTTKNKFTKKKLTKDKKYYIRVYVIIDGEKIYSNVKSIKIKK